MRVQFQSEVTDIAYNSSRVKPGCCFVAIPGGVRDGHDFVPMAVHAGARVIVTERPVSVPATVENVVVENSRDALARLSAEYFAHPSREMMLVGVTGTNGKTTITYLMESIWRVWKQTPGVIGTVNARFAGNTESVSHTTPESYEVQRLLRHMRNTHVRAAIMEVSSHALVQSRVVGCDFDGAIFTNLTQDHLDYHRDMEDYFQSKARLFRERLVVSHKRRVWSVVNWDDEYGKRLTQGSGYLSYRYSRSDVACEVYPRQMLVTTDGIAMEVMTPKGNLRVHSKLRGHFNVSNILAVIAASVLQGIPMEVIREGIESLSLVPGRLEPCGVPGGPAVFVDYAHTPDALLHVTKALKAICKGRLITVFGCGGDRDRGKRPLMGEIAATHSDFIVVTSDNPRTEDPMTIIHEIMSGVGRSPNAMQHLVEPDRRAGIRAALKMASPKDIVLIAGKGHEDYQIIGTTKHHFDDREVVAEYYLTHNQARERR